MKILIYLLTLILTTQITTFAQLELSINHKVNVTIDKSIPDTSIIDKMYKKFGDELYQKYNGNISAVYDGKKYIFLLKLTFNSFNEKFDCYNKNKIYEFFNKLKADYKNVIIDSEDDLVYKDTRIPTALKIIAKPKKANSGSVKGQITDYDTKEPLIGANIIILETLYGDVTDINGNFQIEEIPCGIYKIKVSSIVYKEETIDSIIITANSELELNIELKDYSYKWEEQADIDISNGDIFILIGGLAIFPIDFEELNDIADDYGFQYVTMGCEFLWEDRYNKKMYEYLDKINGDGWKDRMQEEIDEAAREEAEELINNN